MDLKLRPQTYDEVRDAVAGLRGSGRNALVVGGSTLVDVAEVAPPADCVIETTALDRILDHEPADLIVTCQAGVTLAALNQQLAAQRQVLPVWHPSAERATIGGLVAFGWSGPGTGLYGRLRDRVLEVRVVTGEAKLVRGGAKVVKNVTGFDLPRLFCGSMGTLGVVCEMTLKVQPDPGEMFGVRVTGRLEQVLGSLRAAVMSTAQPVEALVRQAGEAWEGIMWSPGPAEDADAVLGGLQAGERVPDARSVFAAMAADELTCPSRGDEIVVRMAVPPSQLSDAAGRITWGTRALIDVVAGVIWTVARDAAQVEDLRRAATAVGGSLVVLRAGSTVRQQVGTWGPAPAGIEVMRRLKAQFDPDGVLGRGRYVV